MLGEAPPAGSIYVRGRCMFVDGTINREGLPRLQPSTATTKVKVSKPSTSKDTAFRALPTIDSEVESLPSHTPIRKQKLVPVVELPVRPPARPFKVVKAPSGKRKPERPASRAAPTPEVISIDMSSEAQASSDDSGDEVKEKEPLEDVDSDSEYDDTIASRKRKAKATSGSRSRKRRAPSSDLDVASLPTNGRKDIKGKGKATDQDAEKMTGKQHSRT